MSEELQKNPSSQEEEIDLLELALKVWGERKFILKACGYAVLIGLVIVFSIPREYTAEAMIAPELSDNKGTGGLSSLAAMAVLILMPHLVQMQYILIYILISLVLLLLLRDFLMFELRIWMKRLILHFIVI